MRDWKDILLTKLLDCGYADLQILEDCEYDFDDLISEIEAMGYKKPDINNLCFAMFQLALNDFQDTIDERINELKEQDELTEEEQEELDAIEGLDVREDTESYHNCIDTSIWFNNNEDIYIKYFQSALDDFEEHTGFSIR